LVRCRRVPLGPPRWAARPSRGDRGAALEGLVAQHLRAWIDYGAAEATLHSWRTKSGNEVDFVVYGRDGFWAIEVKNSASVRPEDLRGLRAFHEDYPQARRALLYRGSRRLRIDGVSCLPCEEFLASFAGGDLPI
jgi:predicted AAA+ superfamily ATPase